MIERALDENEVSIAVQKWLESRGYQARALTAGQSGIDVVGWHPVSGHRWAIEAKGATSSKGWTKQFGAPISEGAAYNGVSKALLNAIHWMGIPAFSGTSIGIAFPNDHHFNAWLDRITPTCKLLGIAIFKIDENDLVLGYPEECEGDVLERPSALTMPGRKIPKSLRRNFGEVPPYDDDVEG